MLRALKLLAILYLSFASLLLASLSAAEKPTETKKTKPKYPLIGPGVPKMKFKQEELFKVVGVINSKLGIIHGHSLLAMHKGYLAIVGSRDSGRGDGNFAFFDISDIRKPKLVARYNSPKTRNLREAHAYGFTIVDDRDIVIMLARDGLQFWDWTDVRAAKKVSELKLPPMRGGDYSGTPWWLSVQGKYVYVGGADTGLHIVDASDPKNPKQARVVPVSRTGGFRIGPVFAVGNLLVLTSMDTPGISTFDISNPGNPILQATLRQTVGYSSMLNGNKLYSVDVIPRVWDMSERGKIKLISDYKGPKLGGKGGYGIIQDGFMHQGVSSNYAKVDFRDPKQPKLIGKIVSGVKGSDLDGGNVIGNFGIGSCDHSKGTFIAPHTTEPDTRGPAVTMVDPADGAINQAITSRLGLTFSDQVDIRSISPETLTVREVGGKILSGRYSSQTGIVAFWPDQPLSRSTTYEIDIAKGGLKDYAGNANEEGFTSRFSTGAALSDFPMTLASNRPVETGSEITFTVTQADADQGTTLSWNFGDGSEPTPFKIERKVRHTYEKPGHYVVIAKAKSGGRTGAASIMQTIHRPISNFKPTRSSSVVLDEARKRAWNVNPDNDTVTATDTEKLTLLMEKPVGKHPRTLALAKDGSIWVVNQDDATISILDGDTGEGKSVLRLPFGSRPFGIAFGPDGKSAYVATQGTGELVRVNAASRKIEGLVHIGGKLRGVAITSNSKRIFVTRFISPADHGEIIEVSADTLQVVRRIKLALDPGPDKEDSSRGVPNYISSIVISPDGRRAWIPSKKDNTVRGLQRDGKKPSFESTVRTIVSQIDLATGLEDLKSRRDLNDRDMASAVAFSSRGDYAFVATQGTNTVEVLDAYDGRPISAIMGAGLAPQGLAISKDGSRLFVHYFMSRSLAVNDISGIVNNFENTAKQLANIKTVNKEKLSGKVLQGKQIFYNANDFHMNRDNYISCASCHLDGGNDGRIWDFTDRGEGLRNTTELSGRRGIGHGRVHWTANFDEIQDFEHDIRGPFGGSGFMDNKRFGRVKYPLVGKKAGQSRELDAIAAYVTSLDKFPDSPHRNPDGSMTPDAIAGRKIFNDLKCFGCHGGADFTDSAKGVLHNVGTVSRRSGKRLGGLLPGIDTPTLRGIWDTPPYFHDGSAETVMDVITRSNPNGLHGATHKLSADQQKQLVAYLMQLDGSEEAALESRHSIVTKAKAAPKDEMKELEDIEKGAGIEEGEIAGIKVPEPKQKNKEPMKPKAYILSVVTSELLGKITKIEYLAASADRNPNFTRVGETTKAPYTYKWKAPERSTVLLARAHFENGSTSTSPELRFIVKSKAPPKSRKRGPAKNRFKTVKNGLKIGALAYQDRRYKFTKFPDYLKGATYLMTRNNDKRTRDHKHITLDIKKPATIYVALDYRATASPGWLKEWVKKNEPFETDDTKFVLYSKKFGKGKAILGDNGSGSSMYVVMLK